ncbi:MAG: DUF378 domain-containing protein [Patescibacteria group bacterium]|nr:DUF378 domain-containing protein [Patescibacteria group bacterium]
MKQLHMIAFILLVIGGINWLLFGIFNWELSALVGGPGSLIAKIVFVVIGLAAIYELATHRHNCKTCSKSPSGNQPVRM